MSLYGPDAAPVLGQGASGAGWMGGSPADQKTRRPNRDYPETQMVRWTRRAGGNLKREAQERLARARKNTNLARGGTPWWRNRPSWKIGTKLNFCATIPLTWTAILCDAKPSVSYSAMDREKQKRADIATAAWTMAYDKHNWEQKIHDAVLAARVQTRAYLSLRPHLVGGGDQVEPRLRVFLGEQVFMDKNASCIDEAEIVMAEYPESYGSLCSRFPGLRSKLRRKYDQPRDESRQNQDVLAPPGTYNLPTGDSVTTPVYAASESPPESGTAGLMVREFWTRPHSTIDIDEVQFLASGEPATRPKMFDTVDPEDEEPLRRITTEAGVVYELPESLVSALQNGSENGGVRIVDDRPALEAVTHKVKYPLYPDGRLVVIVDEDIEADDRMNPLGYFPFAEIVANSDPGGGQHGPSDVDLIADAYEQLVRLVCLVHDTAHTVGNPLWRIPLESELSNDDITNAPGAIQREDLTTLRYGKREPGVDLPQYILLHIKWLVEQIKDLSGLSDVAVGKMAPKTQISTETMTLSQEASGVRFRDSLASISRCMRTLGEQFLEFMARFYTAPVLVQIKNDAGVPEPVPMLSAYLTEPMVVEAKAGSRQPSGPSARINTLLNMKQAGVPMALTTVYELLEELGAIPSATAQMRQIDTLMKNPALRWQVLGLAPPGGQAKKPTSKRSRKSGGVAG